MKEKTLKYNLDDWVKAYEEAVRKATGYSKYSVGKSSGPMFTRLFSQYQAVNPYFFMEAVFPPYCTWRAKDRKGYRDVPYPFPNMLVSRRGEEAYQRHLRKGLKDTKSREEAILQEAKDTAERLTTLGIVFDGQENVEYESIWSLYEDGMVSAFFMIMIPGFLSWLAGQTRRKKISFKCYTALVAKKEILTQYNGLQTAIQKIIRGQENSV